MARIRFGRVSLALTITLHVGLASAVSADPIKATYNMTGSIGTTGIVGTPDVTFQGVTNGSLTTGQLIALGQFIVNPQAEGAQATYTTPFQITFTVTGASGDPALPGSTPVTVDGALITGTAGGRPTLQAMYR